MALVVLALGKMLLSLCCLGATSVQVCTAAMKHGFRIVEDMCEGMSNWMDEKGFKTPMILLANRLKKLHIGKTLISTIIT